MRTAIDAAMLLGRWTLIAQRHATGCSCCPGLGDVPIDRVEESVLAWLRERHPLLAQRESVTQLLKECVAAPEPDQAGLEALFRDLGEALEHLEKVQRGF